MFEYKTNAEILAMTDEELTKYQTEKAAHEKSEVKRQIEAAIEEANKNNASKEEIESLKAELAKAKKAVDDSILTIKAMKESGVSVGKDRSMTPIKEAILQNKERIASLKDNGGKFNVEIKADHNPTDIADREQLGQFEAGVSAIPHRRV